MWVNLTNCLQININNFANVRPLPGLIPGPIASQEVGRGLHVGIIDLFCLLFFLQCKQEIHLFGSPAKNWLFCSKQISNPVIRSLSLWIDLTDHFGPQVGTFKPIVVVAHSKFFFAHDLVNPWNEFLYVRVDTRHCTEIENKNNRVSVMGRMNVSTK